MRAGWLRVGLALLCASFVSGGAGFAQNGASNSSASAGETPGSTSATTHDANVSHNSSVDAQTPKRIGGGVAPPQVVYQVDPQFSEEARQKKVSGQVLISLLVDESGNPMNVRVVRGIGMGLDEKALEAVRQYKFKPAMQDGKPVTVQLNIRVNFQIDGKKPVAPVAPQPAAPGAQGAPAAQGTPAAQGVTAPYLSDPKFISAMADAKKTSASGQVGFAIDAYKKADKVAGGKCSECLNQAITLDFKLGEYKDAAKLAAELAARAGTPLDKSKAESLEGQALYAEGGDKPKPAQLEAAHAALKAAIADYPSNVPALFLDGTVLARMGQMDEARQQFEASVAIASPGDPAYARAKHFAENPALSYQKRAPAFTVTALDGSKFTLDDMGGRVVLIDFWATWCGPCNEELPHMKKIAKEFAGQPLVILSVSWDDDAEKWKAFMAKNEMTWMQYRDADRALTKRFGITAIPHYFTIDSDGVLTSEMLGSGSDVEGKLKKLVAKAKAQQAVSVASAGE